MNDLRKRVGNLVAAFYLGKDMKICNLIVSITTSLLFWLRREAEEGFRSRVFISATLRWDDTIHRGGASALA